MHRFPQQCLASALLVLCSLALTACLSSDKSLIERDARVLPFTSPITIEVYERENVSEPWRKQKDLVTLVADDQLLVRMKNDQGDTYAFYPLEPRRFLVEARLRSEGRFAYGVLDIRNGEGILHHLECKDLDQAAIKAAGATVTGETYKDCALDKVADPLALLKSFAAKPTGSQQRYVPVR